MKKRNLNLNAVQCSNSGNGTLENGHLDSVSIFFDDIDYNQEKEKTGLCDEKGNQYFGSTYVPVEKMNEKTSAFLKTIAQKRTESAKDYRYKPENERWYASLIYWDVNKEIEEKYDVKIEIEQGSLYYRGTWLMVKVTSSEKNQKDLMETARKFCADYGVDTRKELKINSCYQLEMTKEQKKRQEEDDRTDYFFDSMD